MWILLTLLHFCIGWLAAKAGDVSVSCSSCSRNRLSGTVGGQIVVQYSVNNQNFKLLTIFYNSTKNFFDVAPDLVNSEHIKDPRFTIEKSLTGSSVLVRIELRDLTLRDNGAFFKYVYKDSKLKEFQGVHVLEVRHKQSSHSGGGGDTSYNLIIIVCVAVVVVIVAILILCLDES